MEIWFIERKNLEIEFLSRHDFTYPRNAIALMPGIELVLSFLWGTHQYDTKRNYQNSGYN
jgi:hypothetical protein